jgi:hypothetical protein
MTTPIGHIDSNVVPPIITPQVVTPQVLTPQVVTPHVAAPDTTAQVQATGTTGARSGTAVTAQPATPDFGPAAVFTPSQELARLAASQRTSVLTAAETLAANNAANNTVGASAGSAFVPADLIQANQFTMYNSTGIAVPLSQAVAAGAVPLAQMTTDQATLRPQPASEVVEATPAVP